MSWTLVAQIATLMALGTFLAVAAHSSIADKRREDAHKRKEAGL